MSLKYGVFLQQRHQQPPRRGCENRVVSWCLVCFSSFSVVDSSKTTLDNEQVYSDFLPRDFSFCKLRRTLAAPLSHLAATSLLAEGVFDAIVVPFSAIRFRTTTKPEW